MQKALRDLRPSFFPGVLAFLMALPAVSSAAITLYTDEALYNAASGNNGYVENFSAVTPGYHPFVDVTPDTSASPIDYVVASNGAIWRNVDPSEYGTWLATNDPGENILVGFYDGNGASAGGHFFLTDENEGTVAGNLNIVVHGEIQGVDQQDFTITLTSAASGPQPFFGVVATDGDIIGAIEIVPSTAYATFTDFQASAVPESGAVMLGLAGVLVAARRRQR
jgi:hypothetical protein